MSTKIKYTATLPNGETLTRTSVRPVAAIHVAIKKEDGKLGSFRWTVNANPIAKASASSCGARLGYWTHGYHPEAKQWNAQADKYKAELDAAYDYLIIPAVAA